MNFVTKVSIYEKCFLNLNYHLQAMWAMPSICTGPFWKLPVLKINLGSFSGILVIFFRGFFQLKFRWIPSDTISEIWDKHWQASDRKPSEWFNAIGQRGPTVPLCAVSWSTFSATKPCRARNRDLGNAPWHSIFFLPGFYLIPRSDFSPMARDTWGVGAPWGRKGAVKAICLLLARRPPRSLGPGSPPHSWCSLQSWQVFFESFFYYVFFLKKPVFKWGRFGKFFAVWHIFDFRLVNEGIICVILPPKQVFKSHTK